MPGQGKAVNQNILDDFYGGGGDNEKRISKH